MARFGTSRLDYTWYVRDAQGNTMAVYNYSSASGLSAGTLRLNEQHLYGSSRIGILNRDENAENALPNTNFTNFTRGNKFFELANHLGNVLTTISDRKTPANTGVGNTVTYYKPVVLTANDYYPFGMLMPGRNYNAANVKDFRYGFNGKENDNDVKGEGNQQDYGMRIYDARLGRFLSVDPLSPQYPWNSTYSFGENDVIRCADLDGGEKIVKTVTSSTSNGKTILTTVTDSDVPNGYTRLVDPPKVDIAKQVVRHMIKKYGAPNNDGEFIYYEFSEDASKNYAQYNTIKDGVAYSRKIEPATLKWMFDEYGKSEVRNEQTLAIAVQLAQLAGALGAIKGTLASAEMKATAGEAKNVSTGNNTTSVVVVLDKAGKRKALAEKYFTNAGKNTADVTNLMNTIDFSRAVSEKILTVGERVYRFERTNSTGTDKHFFTDAHGADAGPTGVGFASPQGYHLVTYKVTKNTTVLHSTIRYQGQKQYFSTELQNNIKKVSQESP